VSCLALMVGVWLFHKCYIRGQEQIVVTSSVDFARKAAAVMWGVAALLAMHAAGWC
jgi:hypothetical protein